MIYFWLSIAIMTIIAMLVAVLPLIRHHFVKQLNHEQLQVSIFKEKLLTLTKEFTNKDITESEYQSARAELEKSLLGENVAATKIKANIKPAYLLAFLIAIALPITAITYYINTGASQALTQKIVLAQKSAEIKKEMANLGTPDKIITALKQRLQQDPNSARGWFLLGRIYLSTQQYEEAVGALAKANQLTTNQPDILLPYAEALYFANKPSMNAKALQILNQLLKIQPNNINALNLIALNAYADKQYQQAIDYWEKILPQFAQDSTDQKALLGMIADAQRHLSGQPSSGAQSEIKLPIIVSLANGLERKVSPNEAVYIYVKAVNGPAMPLLAIKKQVKNLPLKMTLDQSMVMVPQLSLASFNQLKIFARVSKSNQALSQKGDFIGESTIIFSHQMQTSIPIVIQSVIQ